MPIARILPGFDVRKLASSLPVIILPLAAGRKPGLDERRGGEILLVGDGLGDESFQIKLLAACDQFLSILVPGAPATPVFFGVNERDERHERGQAKEKSTNGAPVE